MKRALLVLITLQTGAFANAQHQEINGQPPLWKGKQQQTADTASLLHAFKTGQIHGHFRYFFMATDNKTGLTDFYANAVGGGIKFESAPYKGFQFGVSGFFIFNIGSSALSKPDPKTNQFSRYEQGLFDVEDRYNKTDIDRLEELYLKYNRKQSHITLGRQLINTPFINLQDSRMRPTEAGGIYAEINDIKNTKIEAGYLFEVSPRGTVRWYTAAESIGLYSQGVNPDGTRSEYKGNLKSKGIGIIGITYNAGDCLSLKAYDVFTENIFNSLLVQAHYSYPLKDKSKLVAGLQFIRQDAINNGGNADQRKTYFPKGGKSQTFGAKMGWENDRWQTSLNYNRITAHGRYLMPREWGREPFFTYLSRERNEGLGDVDAYVFKLGYTIPKLRLKTQTGIGYFNLPEATRFALNKYGMPSYTQLNIDIHHEFEGWLKGLEAHFLYVYKGRSGDSFGNDKYVINKVDVSSWNFIFNYHF
ncbi:OprD family outer membrane porin [Niastella populi]|uniref:Porin n=1 Tax=Niastella populi TaxID=550983 RepID=A0A1V9FL72_9BACT|nr:OprD family outer membrane porin [Niastella populi]OQP59047.1 hypothetical protein A4R26_21915 [Niastella populi]